MKNELYSDFAVKYRVVSLGNFEYLLFPLSVVAGFQIGDVFNSSSKYKVLSSIDKLENNSYVIDNILTDEDLKMLYDFDDINFLKEYYFEDVKNVLLYVTFKDSKMVKREVNLDMLRKYEYIDTYMMVDEFPSVVLNDVSLDKLLNSTDMKELKLYLKKYKDNVKEFDVQKRENGVTRLEFTNGKVTKIDSSRVSSELEKDNICEDRDFSSKNDISYDGLRNYIKERVIGHDKEIDIISKILYMNYTAVKGERTDSILLVGPTGTGKTETFNAAMNYLNLPLVTVNTSNLVPQGIKGCSLEDCLYTLYLRSGKNLALAEKGIVFLDEYDKLSSIETDFKRDLRNILLTFNAGGDFNIESNSSTFVLNSSLVSKVYAGVFEDIYKNKSIMGFSKTEQKSKLTDIRGTLLDKEYFTLEELSRIKYILSYETLSKEVKKKIILESKLSEFYIKKMRYERQFGVSLEMDDSYIDAILDKISSSSMRDINNIISSSLDMAEIEMIQSSNLNGKKLVLTKDTVLNPKNYVLN